ncbi:MarR family winged helix-turn-helix transcriptional regulator [Coralloluteibacterium stylophorae]|uniref:MarR family transcriptional regulator n=1 Tax=Coralloluteibacterium stylophorae TaxID=1776034 RepID=A0A8J7VRA5_9GAMM|nr:MarR family transcriptional regulator [Coralloluteibacterium stylophorae]MBS7457168.1 MarR family transcriptional regulator [Coralloluteibacterium stylophorae]
MHGDDDFVAGLGPAFLAHMLRRVSDRLVEAETAWHEEAGLASPPRTSSTLLALARHGPQPVTGLARLLKQSHQLVQQWIRTLSAAGLVKARADPADARRSLIALTARGQRHVADLELTLAACEQATTALLAAVAPDLEAQLWRLEQTLSGSDFTADIRRAYRSATKE